MNTKSIAQRQAALETKIFRATQRGLLEERQYGSPSSSTQYELRSLGREYTDLMGGAAGGGKSGNPFGGIKDGAATLSEGLARLRASLGGEASGAGVSSSQKAGDTIGDQVIQSAVYEAFRSKKANTGQLMTKNTLAGLATTVAPDRQLGGFGAVAWRMSLESLIPGFRTELGAVEFTQESAATGSAAEAAEGAAAAESSVSVAPMIAPVQTIWRFLKVSRQLLEDSQRFAEWINSVLVVALNRRVEAQIIGGDGVAPNLAGLNVAGNFTAHGYASAGLGAIHQRAELIRRVIEDIELTGEGADGVILNPADWSTIERLKDAQSRYLSEPFAGGPRLLWKVPVISSSAMPADKFLVGAFRTSAEIYNREGVAIQFSEHDSDNFRKGLITVRVSRRVGLAVTRPASIRGGDLTPA